MQRDLVFAEMTLTSCRSWCESALLFHGRRLVGHGVSLRFDFMRTLFWAHYRRLHAGTLPI